MAGRTWKNTYRLSDSQLEQLDQAESMMEKMDLGSAEELLERMLEEDPLCIPVLSNLGHLYGRHLSEFEKAVEYYSRVLEIEPDNAWARDERRRYQRYLTYDED
ncbi:MAG: tetratricopeptide repeat protein [Candidatus Thalassarchaeaceae archaeon]|nr:tetratricopeptide repeat protein [Candidatus Thalassarchaeaceae archaeon]